MASFSHPFGESDRYRRCFGLRLGALPQQLAQGILDRFLLESLGTLGDPVGGPDFLGQFHWVAIFGKKKW